MLWEFWSLSRPEEGSSLDHWKLYQQVVQTWWVCVTRMRRLRGEMGLIEALFCSMASPPHYRYPRKVEQLDAASCHMSAFHAQLTAPYASLVHFTDLIWSKQESTDYLLLPQVPQRESWTLYNWALGVSVYSCIHRSLSISAKGQNSLHLLYIHVHVPWHCPATSLFLVRRV